MKTMRKSLQSLQGGDKYSEMIANVFRFLDKGQRPTLLKSNDESIVVEEIDGISLDKIKIPRKFIFRD